MKPRPFPFETNRYPFSDTSSFQITETLMFPPDFIVDAHLYAYSDGIYEITRIVKSRSKLTLYIGTSAAENIIIGHYDLPYEEEGTIFRDTIDLVDQYGRCAGVLMVDVNEAFMFFPNGDYSLDYGTLQFEGACHIPVAHASVHGFLVNGEFVSGDVKFVGTPGAILERSNDEGTLADPDSGGNEVTIHFTGEPYYRLWLNRENSGYFTRFVSKVRLIVRDKLVRNPDMGYWREVTLTPDANGNIPIYTKNIGVIDEGALRIIGEKDRLIIKLAK